MSPWFVQAQNPILDLGLTTEYLETFGVPLIGYRNKIIAGIFCRASPLRSGIRLDEQCKRDCPREWRWNGNRPERWSGLFNPDSEAYAMAEEN